MAPETVIQSQKRPSRLRNFIENILYIGAAILLAVIIQAFIVRPFIVSGSSMDPTIKNSQYLIIDEISYRIHDPERGDVVVFKAPPEPTKYYIKRIIGVPGDTVEIKGTKVTITNKEHPEGFTLSEDFITHPHLDTIKISIPAGQYYVMGDNRDGSYDSRSWGTVPRENIRGRALLRLFPLTEINYLPGKVNYE